MHTSPPSADPDYAGAVTEAMWPGVAMHVVSGKGGAGKTTIAAALALALAHDGRRTLLMEVEGRQGIAQLFDTPPLPYTERKVAVAPTNAVLPTLPPSGYGCKWCDARFERCTQLGQHVAHKHPGKSKHY